MYPTPLGGVGSVFVPATGVNEYPTPLCGAVSVLGPAADALEYGVDCPFDRGKLAEA